MNRPWLVRFLASIPAVLLLLLWLPTYANGQSDSLRRQPHWGLLLSPPEAKPGATVGRVDAGSSAERAGLKSGDTILEMNGKLLTDGAAYRAITRSVRGGDKVSMRVSRGDKTISISFEVPALPKETIPGAQVLYDSVVTDRGHRLRTIVTRPESARGR